VDTGVEPRCSRVNPDKPQVLAASSAVGLAGVVLGHFMVDFCSSWLPPLLPLLAERLDLTMALAGTAVATASTVSSFSQPLLGWLGDRGGGRALLAFSVIWTCAFTSLVGLVRGFGALVAVVLLAGLGSAFYHPLGSVSAVRLYPRHRSKVMSLYSAGGSLGYALAPVVAVPLVLKLGLGASLLLMVPGVLLAGLKLGSARPPVAAAQTRMVDEHRPVAGARYGALAWLQLVMALRCWALTSHAAFLVWYLVERGGEPTWAAAVLTAFLLAGVVGGVIGGVLADRWGNLAVLCWSGLVAIVSLWVFLGRAGWPATACLVLGGAALHAGFPGAVVLAQELVPARAGMAAGMMMGLTFGIGGLGVAATGWLGDAWGLTRALQVTLLGLAASTALAPVADRRARGDAA